MSRIYEAVLVFDLGPLGLPKVTLLSYSVALLRKLEAYATLRNKDDYAMGNCLIS